MVTLFEIARGVVVGDGVSVEVLLLLLLLLSERSRLSKVVGRSISCVRGAATDWWMSRASCRGTMTGGSNLATKRTSGSFGCGSRAESMVRVPAPALGEEGDRNVGGGSCHSVAVSFGGRLGGSVGGSF